MTYALELKQGAEALALDLSEEQLLRLQDYLALLVKWNRAFNLTAIRDAAHMVSYHLLDSLALRPYVCSGLRLLDVGSGGGLPGVPIAIACPTLQVVLLDANEKKTTFLRQVAIELKLQNVQIVTARVEQYQIEEGFDCITTRAFSRLAEFVQLTRPLLAHGGEWLAMKGAYPQDEIAALPSWVHRIDVLRLTVPGLMAERHLVRMHAA